MRRFYTLLAMLGAGAGLQAQSSFTDDFESYTLGAYVAQASPNWTTWSNAPGGPEDAMVVNTQASSGTQSIYFNSTAATGGPQDLVLPFGGVHTTGQFTYEMDMFVSANKGAYFNFQGEATIGNLWVLDAFFLQTGAYSITASGATVVAGTYPTATWFTLRIDINLNTNLWEVYVDNVLQGSFSNPNNKIASIDIYPVNQTSNGGNGQAQFWVDDVSYTHTPYTLPSLNAAVVAAGGMNPATRTPGNLGGYVGQSRKISAMVRNLGTSPITSFELGYGYSSNTDNVALSGLNIPSLATYVVEFTVPATLVAGLSPLVVTVSNANGMGADGDPADDVSNRDVNITVVPAANKKVLVEEGTGTWCQWCPRGAVYMDYMAENYHDVFAGVAVHNGDPMTIPSYDTPFSSLIGGYPSIITDRGQESDPLDIEAQVLAHLALPVTATILNGAAWNPGTRELDVSLTYDFVSAADQDWRLACIILEDSVTGTTGYAQSNAYGNNGSGPMGGFELLGTSVPAALMNYNHVARTIAPDFLGALPFSGPVNASSQHIFNFNFTLPATWDENQIRIVGVLINPNGEADNASDLSMADAIANGFAVGTVIVGVSKPAQPDQLVSLYPNPAHGNAWLSLNLNADTEVEVSISDIQGRELAKHNYGIMNGGQLLPIHTQSLAKGVYMVNVSLNGVAKVQRLVVE